MIKMDVKGNARKIVGDPFISFYRQLYPLQDHDSADAVVFIEDAISIDM